MFGFNIYFCIKQGKIATFSTSLQGLAVRRLTSSLTYHPGDNLFILQLSMTGKMSENFSNIEAIWVIFSFKEAIKLIDGYSSRFKYLHIFSLTFFIFLMIQTYNKIIPSSKRRYMFCLLITLYQLIQISFLAYIARVAF